MQTYPYTDLVMVLAILFYIWTAMKVGGARGTYKVPAPATDGPPEFQRIFRIQMNTLEQIVWFLPALWLFASAWGDIYAAAIGIFWPIGRILFARGYLVAAEKRGLGFGITFFTSAILLLGGLAGTIRNML
ncbi:MAG: MAPEG family protein [Rhodospirillaceae bacterium]|nr:MAG: MAPEG family protein [Rhodospirillaceae bacterium]